MSLKISALSKHFSEKKIFENFSYSFDETGLYLLTGESGIGKTTLLRIIAGLDKDYTGEISLVSKPSYAFQEHRLFPQLSALENVAMAVYNEPSEAEYEAAKRLLKHLKFTDVDLGLTPDALSGGMKQRVSLARAILSPAPILLLDEPLRELDNDLREILLSLIYEEAKKRLIIMVTHDSDKVTLPTLKIINLKKN